MIDFIVDPCYYRGHSYPDVAGKQAECQHHQRVGEVDDDVVLDEEVVAEAYGEIEERHLDYAHEQSLYANVYHEAYHDNYEAAYEGDCPVGVAVQLVEVTARKDGGYGVGMDVYARHGSRNGRNVQVVGVVGGSYEHYLVDQLLGAVGKLLG